MSATFSERVVIPSIVCHISGYRKNSKMSRVIIGTNEDKYISYKDPPRIRPDMEFVKWKKEVAMWQVITKLPKSEQALALALSFEGIFRNWAMRMPISQLNAEDGVDQLLRYFERKIRCGIMCYWQV